MTDLIRDYAPLSLLVPPAVACVAVLVYGAVQSYRTRRKVQAWWGAAPPDPEPVQPFDCSHIEGPVDLGLSHQGD